MSKEYNEKLKAVDDSITEMIIKTAKAKGYKTVFAKSVVVYGGDDITEEVINLVK